MFFYISTEVFKGKIIGQYYCQEDYKKGGLGVRRVSFRTRVTGGGVAFRAQD
jgi:hypothetical protein